MLLPLRDDRFLVVVQWHTNNRDPVDVMRVPGPHAYLLPLALQVINAEDKVIPDRDRISHGRLQSSQIGPMLKLLEGYG